jgi:hypothetical protein
MISVGDFNKVISTVKQYSNFNSDLQVQGCKRAVLDSIMLTFSKLEEYASSKDEIEKEKVLSQLKRISSICILNLSGLCNYFHIRLKVNEQELEEKIIIEDMCQTLFNLCDLVLSIEVIDSSKYEKENTISIFNFVKNYTDLLEANNCVLSYEIISDTLSEK